MAKLSAGNIIAIEAKYHCKCLVALYNRAARHNEETNFHGIAFPELVEC